MAKDTTKSQVNGLIAVLENRKAKHLMKNNLNPSKQALADELDDIVKLVKEMFFNEYVPDPQKHHPECPAVGGYPCYCNGEQLEPYYIELMAKKREEMTEAVKMKGAVKDE